MRKILLIIAFSIILTSLLTAQDTTWQCVYATYDNRDNGTGYRTISVGVIKENTFVALVSRPDSRCFLIPYADADSAKGRVYSFGYSGETSGIFMEWVNPNDAFDVDSMYNAYHVTATPDSLIYVANNGASHNILVYKFTGDTILSTPWRIETGDVDLSSIAIDSQGRVYVLNDTSNGVTDDIKIYPSISENKQAWETHSNVQPIATLDLPDGVYKGLAVNSDGSVIYVSVSDTGSRKVIKYTGSVTGGYTLDQTFSFSLSPDDTASGGYKPVPLHLAYLEPNNILFVACDTWLQTTYDYGRIYLLNGTTGDPIDTIDVAMWNFLHLDSSYTHRVNGTDPGNASGYTSTFDVKLDENKNLYSQSWYGWTVEKWTYPGTLPILELKQVSNTIPEGYKLYQNYPNPFNPSTTIEFEIPKKTHVTLKIYTILGQEVATLVDKTLEPGRYKVTFDATGLATGSYIYTLKAGSYVESKKLMLLK